MRHLIYDELLQLAEASASQEGFDDIQIEQLEHLKTCKDCYETFCLLSALSDIMSESGSYAFRNPDSISIVSETVKELKNKVIAKFQVIRNVATTAIDAVFEQIDQAASVLQFGPSLATATRGSGKADSTTIRLEEFEDDKTYVVFDPEKNEIGLQINIRGMEIESLHVFIELDDSTRLELPVIRRGNIVKGNMGDIPNCNFQITIEAE